MHLSCQKQAEKYLKHTILAILFKKPTYLKNPWVFSFKKPILPAGFLNGFFTSYIPDSYAHSCNQSLFVPLP